MDNSRAGRAAISDRRQSSGRSTGSSSLIRPASEAEPVLFDFTKMRVHAIGRSAVAFQMSCPPMKAPPDHLPFLNQKDFVLGCEDVFSQTENAILARYGRWLEALIAGKIFPITAAEERFLRVDRGEIEPETDFERAWCKLKERREFEAASRDSTHCRVFDEKEAWFPRSQHWRYRG